jgi:uncharacterized RDD family membrane protein YckC
LAAGIDAAAVSGLAATPWALGLVTLDLYRAPPTRFLLDHLLELWILRPGSFLGPVLWWGGLWIAWHVLWTYLWAGQTPGCRALRLRFLDRHADPLRWHHIALRALGHVLSIATLGLGWLWVLVSANRCSWPDVLSRTHLIDES